MALNTNYFAHETELLVRIIKPSVIDMNDMLQFCTHSIVNDWNYYPSFIPLLGMYGEPTVDPAYFWFSDIKDCTLFRLRFDSQSAMTSVT